MVDDKREERVRDTEVNGKKYELTDEKVGKSGGKLSKQKKYKEIMFFSL